MGCVTGIAECHDFRVRLPRRLRETRADLFVASHQDATYRGIGG
jgi:hypothetical protein